MDAVREVKTVILPPLPRPDDDDVPHWSPETEAALVALLPVERAFVEQLASGGCSQSEAYRRATGKYRDGSEADYSRMRGYRFLSRPRVMAAFTLAMKDMSFGPRMSRDWLLQKLEVAVDRAEESKTTSPESLARIVRIIAELKGELLPPAPQQVTVTHEASPAMKRFLAAIELAKKTAGIEEPNG